MKKGYYIHFQGRLSVGVNKKIDMQMQEFRKHFDMEELEIVTPERTLLQRLLTLFPFASIKRNYAEALEKVDAPDFFYVRRTVADRAYCAFWKEIRKRYPNCKIIIEIFTYPYDKDDFGMWNAWPFYLKELLNRWKLKYYIDRFVTYTQDREIFGVPTICTTNGVDVDSIRKVQGRYRENCLTLIGVAYMQRQHGYERVIEGLHNYYQNSAGTYRINLHLVGDGPEKSKYQKMVSEYRLQEYVTFWPITTGSELDKLYDDADMALAVFGMYKVGYYVPVGAIKTRECLAKGIPMITGIPIDVLDQNHQYALLFPNDNSPIDMFRVIDFFEEIKKDGREKEDVAVELRKFARERASMEVVLRPIIEFIQQ